MQRKRVGRAGGPWCRELTAHSPEGEGSAFRGGAKVTKRGAGGAVAQYHQPTHQQQQQRKKKNKKEVPGRGGWAGDKMEESSSRGSSGGSSSTGETSSSSSCKRVIVVVDHTQESKLAMKWALSHVVQQADVLTLLHVQPPLTQRQLYSSHGPIPPVKVLWRSAGRSDWRSRIDRSRIPSSSSSWRGRYYIGVCLLYLAGSFFNAKAADEVRRKNEVAGWEIANSFKSMAAACRPEVEVEILVVEGEKGPTIVAQTKKLGASILVLGQRKPSVLWRLVKRKTESLADYCINNSECLTLAVRKKSRRLGGYLINSQWQRNFWLLA